jgi:outer membrane receptor protein involved in Fe transport
MQCLSIAAFAGQIVVLSSQNPGLAVSVAINCCNVGLKIVKSTGAAWPKVAIGWTEPPSIMTISNALFGFFGADVTSRSDTTGALLSGAPAVASQEALLKIAGYTLLGLRAGFEPANGPWRLEFWGRNVTNRFYETGATRNSDFVTRFAGMPSTYGISAHYSFGK